MRTPVLALSALAVLLGASTARADVYTVTSPDDSGAGTLREATTVAMANPGGAPHTIQFALPTAPAVIALQTALPTVTVAMAIDATTQAGYVGTPLVILDGTANANMRGFWVSGATGVTIAGFEIHDFGYGGVQVSFSTGVTIRASDIHHGGYGITIYSSIVTIGGNAASDRNVIHDNVNSGIYSSGICNGTVVRNNLIGTNAAGVASAPNATGISISSDSTGVQVGPGNVISGNANSGVIVDNGGTVTIAGNFIGTDATGTAAVPNADGIYSLSANTYVGGNQLAARNVISGNTGAGVFLTGSQGRVVGNFIGTNAAGTAAIPNGRGVWVWGSSTIVGGSTADYGNLISGNSAAGIEVSGTPTNVAVFSNRIGVDAAGTGAIGNGTGILVNGALEVRIGSMNAGNLIANNAYGVRMIAGGTAIIDWNSIVGHSIAGISGNVLTNAPVVTSAVPAGGSISLGMSFVGDPNTNYSIEFFDSPTCEAGGAGATMFGSVGLTTNGAGTTSFSPSYPGSFALGRAVTAIAIREDAPRNTSAFSSCRRVCNPMTFSPATLPAATSGSAYSQPLSATGGTGAFSFAVASGALPAGLSIVGNAIVGTPTVGASSAPITIRATDTVGCSVDANFTFATVCPTIAVTPATIPNPVLGVPYSQSFQASGGAPPYTFTAGGALTAPLVWDAATATVSGTVGDASPSDLTVHATDSRGCEGSIRVMPTGVCPAITITPDVLPGGDPGGTYAATLSATGANGAVTFALAGGTLPPGVTLGSDGALAGPLSGLDAVYSFTVLATGPYACTASKALTITVGNPVIEVPDAGVVGVDAGTDRPRGSGGCAVGAQGGAGTGGMAAFAMLAVASVLVRRRRALSPAAGATGSPARRAG